MDATSIERIEKPRTTTDLSNENSCRFPINRDRARRVLEWHAACEDAWTSFSYKAIPDDPSAWEVLVTPSPGLTIVYKLTQLDEHGVQYQLTFLARLDKRSTTR
jgi:hypothetical protein